MQRSAATSFIRGNATSAFTSCPTLRQVTRHIFAVHVPPLRTVCHPTTVGRTFTSSAPHHHCKSPRTLYFALPRNASSSSDRPKRALLGAASCPLGPPPAFSRRNGSVVGTTTTTMSSRQQEGVFSSSFTATAAAAPLCGGLVAQLAMAMRFARVRGAADATPRGARDDAKDGGGERNSSKTEEGGSSSAGSDNANNNNSTAEGGSNSNQSNPNEGGGSHNGVPPKPPGGIKGHLDGLKFDLKQFPDIYNSANFINGLLFTIFCLCSTGSQTETDWWNDHWGVDGGSVRPWTWILHSWYTNNFLSMCFAMILMHGMCHSVLPTLGSRGLMTYCLLTSVVSGMLMYVTNANFHPDGKGEKQFGPWDIVAAMFVMQYLHMGFLPHQTLLSFNGWVKYACLVGAVCIAYYDWQPLLWGTAVGIVLCKTRFPAPLVKAAA